MLMRKLLVIFGPLLLCLLTCVLFMWMDAWFAAGSFFQYVCKGICLGVGVALMLPVAGIGVRDSGLVSMLWIAAALLLTTLGYQYMETVGVVHWPALKAIISINGQVVLIESTVMGYLTLTALLGRKRKKSA